MLALNIQLRRDRFEAFQRLAEREVRPVEEVLTSYLADFANLIQQRDFADAFGDELPTAPMTQAMRLAAQAEDERERSLYVDDEAAAYEYYAQAAGYVDVTVGTTNVTGATAVPRTPAIVSCWR